MEFDHGNLLCDLLCTITDEVCSRTGMESRSSTKRQLLAWGWNLPAQNSFAVWYCFVKINGPILKPHGMRKGLTQAELMTLYLG